MKITIEDGDRKLEITNPGMTGEKLIGNIAGALSALIQTLGAICPGAKTYTADDQIEAFEKGQASVEAQLDDARAVIDEQNAVITEIRQVLDGAGEGNAVPRFKAIRRAIASLNLDPFEPPVMSREQIHALACDIHEKTVQIRRAFIRGRTAEVASLNEQIHCLAVNLCDEA